MRAFEPPFRVCQKIVSRTEDLSPALFTRYEKEGDNRMCDTLCVMYLKMFAFEFLAIHAFDGVVGRFCGVESHECKSPALTRGLHGCECTCEMVCFSVF